ncbi:MAG: major tail protein [Butyrivibrio sp.]|jgi:phi13 family phage major tail protein|nr:major tail protein [Butyrivibrio sp.]
MAKIGFRFPYVAKLDRSTGVYSEGFKCSHGVSLNITPNYVEGSLYGDDQQVEYEKNFKDATVTLGVTTLPSKAESTMFGHTVEEATGKITYKGNDEGNYVGVGWVTPEKDDGRKVFTANILTTAKFSAGAEEYATKGENLEFKTPTIEGKAITNADDEWKIVIPFDTEAAAENFVKEYLNISDISA